MKAASTNSGGSYDSGVGYIGTGSFVWPMPGYTYITCYYGDGGHRGIDIAGGGIYGKPIVAADGGKVIYSAWMDSYGYCVFIDHGNGYSTRYAHASALACSVVIPSPPAKRLPTWALRAILRARTFTLKLFTTAAPRTRSITFNITLL